MASLVAANRRHAGTKTGAALRISIAQAIYEFSYCERGVLICSPQCNTRLIELCSKLMKVFLLFVPRGLLCTDVWFALLLDLLLA
jgi:hypothetical protein